MLFSIQALQITSAKISVDCNDDVTKSALFWSTVFNQGHPRGWAWIRMLTEAELKLLLSSSPLQFPSSHGDLRYFYFSILYFSSSLQYFHSYLFSFVVTPCPDMKRCYAFCNITLALVQCSFLAAMLSYCFIFRRCLCSRLCYFGAARQHPPRSRSIVLCPSHYLFTAIGQAYYSLTDETAADDTARLCL